MTPTLIARCYFSSKTDELRPFLTQKEWFLTKILLNIPESPIIKISVKHCWKNFYLIKIFRTALRIVLTLIGQCP